MAKTPRLISRELEAVLAKAGFTLVRVKGSHRIFMKSGVRVVIPFHGGKILHPKIIKALLHIEWVKIGGESASHPLLSRAERYFLL